VYSANWRGKSTRENAIKLEFAIDVLLLDLDICRSVDLRRHDDERREAWVSLKREGIDLSSLIAARRLSYVCMFCGERVGEWILSVLGVDGCVV
jgi:hypothetical protein